MIVRLLNAYSGRYPYTTYTLAAFLPPHKHILQFLSNSLKHSLSSLFRATLAPLSLSVRVVRGRPLSIEVQLAEVTSVLFLVLDVP